MQILDPLCPPLSPPSSEMRQPSCTDAISYSFHLRSMLQDVKMNQRPKFELLVDEGTKPDKLQIITHAFGTVPRSAPTVFCCGV